MGIFFNLISVIVTLQMTCDHLYMITSFDARWPGSVHDARIFRESGLDAKFQAIYASNICFNCEIFSIIVPCYFRTI